MSPTIYDSGVDNRIDFMDQGSFLGLRALGFQAFTTCTWLYDREVDIEQLQRFAHHLDRGLLGRLIEQSPVPGARPRWVRLDRPTGLDIEEAPRPRAELDAWLSEVACRPIDPEDGPPYRIGVLTFIEGGSAVVLVVPHTLGDGLCVLNSISDAVRGRDKDLGYPLPGSRGRIRAVLEDLREMLASVPGAFSAIGALLRSAKPATSAKAALKVPPEQLALPVSPVLSNPQADASRAKVYYLDIEQWDACTERLGGTSNSLLGGIAARLGELRGRVLVDGSVNLSIPVSVREKGDTRANALGGVIVTVDPGGVASDLRPVREAMKARLTEFTANPGDLLAALPLTPFVPTWLVRAMERTVMASDVLGVGCSNYGEMPEMLTMIDGEAATRWSVYPQEPRRSAADLERIDGLLYVLSGRIAGQIFLAVTGYTPGGVNTVEQLDADIRTVLDEFGLSATTFG